MWKRIVDESYTKNHLMELMENPDTVWTKTVHHHEYNDKYELRIENALRSLEADEIVADMEIERIGSGKDEYDVVFRFKCLDPYGFADCMNQQIWEYATPYNEPVSEDIDWNMVSTKMSDYRRI